MLITKHYSSRLLAVLAFSLLFASCEKDDGSGDPDNESELITSVILTFVNQSTGETSGFAYTDLDGPGGKAPEVQPITLKWNTTYNVSVKFLDASKPSDIKDLTEEVEEENEEHLVCYEVTGVVPKPVALNTDAGGKDLGTQGKITPTQTGAGTLTVILKHEPDKSSANACSTGETDVETTPAFPVTIVN